MVLAMSLVADRGVLAALTVNPIFSLLDKDVQKPSDIPQIHFGSTF